MPDNKPVTPENTAERLPCRGCTRDCPTYDICDGKPWRINDQLMQQRFRKH